MPILPPEPDCFPENLLVEIASSNSVPPVIAGENADQSDASDAAASDDSTPNVAWSLAYTKSRQEKSLMRQLRGLNVPHYGPQVPKRYRSPGGRIRTSLVPLFANYVFVYGSPEQRQKAISTGCVAKMTEVDDGERLLSDLRQIRSLIEIDVPMTIESRVGPGERVRVRSGPFAGYEGLVDRRDAETRLIVSVQFMDQGVSVKLDDCQLEVI